MPAEKLPKSVELSPHIKERAEFYFVVMLSGHTYYVAITKKTRLALGIKKDGRASSYKKLDEYYEMARDMIDSIYLQVRDVVGAEISSGLSDQIGKGFQKLFDSALDKTVKQKLDQKLLGGKNEQPNE